MTAPPSSSSEAETPPPEPLTSSKDIRQGNMERAERCKPDGAAPKSPCEDGGGTKSQHKMFVFFGVFLVSLSNILIKCLYCSASC